MTLAFRNIDIEPSTPVEEWPYEALVAAVERGTIGDWARVTRAVRLDPWGATSRKVAHYLSYAERSGVAQLLERALASARAQAEAAERAIVAERIGRMVADSGLTAAEFARRVGTSASRLSTYVTGKVVPSATMMVRMERLTAALTAPSAHSAPSATA